MDVKPDHVHGVERARRMFSCQGSQVIASASVSVDPGISCVKDSLFQRDFKGDPANLLESDLPGTFPVLPIASPHLG